MVLCDLFHHPVETHFELHTILNVWIIAIMEEIKYQKNNGILSSTAVLPQKCVTRLFKWLTRMFSASGFKNRSTLTIPTLTPLKLSLLFKIPAGLRVHDLSIINPTSCFLHFPNPSLSSTHFVGNYIKYRRISALNTDSGLPNESPASDTRGLN